MPDEPMTAEPFVPSRGGLDALREAAQSCRGCPLYQDTTQTVFGEGQVGSHVMLVGEQPGDQEDRKGSPFVGPAGGLLDRALEESGISRQEAYLTNVVKHFKFVPPERGKRRIHKKPSSLEIAACRPWFLAELRVIRPTIVVCLGATAAKALMGNSFRVTRNRGQVLDFPAGIDVGEYARPDFVVATVHPSSVVRADDRHTAYREFLADLVVVAKAMKSS